MPISVIDKVNSIFPEKTRSEKTVKNNAFRLLSYLYSKQKGESYTIMSSIYLSKVFNGTYGNFVNKLKEVGIIEGFKTKTSNDSYIVPQAVQNYTGNLKAKGVCKKMRICQKYTLSSLYNNNLQSIKSYKTNSNTSGGFELSTDFVRPVEIAYKQKDRTKEQVEIEKDFIDTVNTLKFDYDKLYHILKNEVESIKASNYIFTDTYGIEDKIVRVSFMGTNTYPMSIGEALKIAKRQCSTLFKDDNKYYITSKPYFEEVKKQNVFNSYSNSIERLRAEDFVASRNETNNRLDTNFTNMPSIFVKQIMSDNNLVQIDLANSQFALLSYHLEKNKLLDTEDFKLFKELSYQGKLYDYIAEKSDILRSVAKKGFFEILFNKAGINSKEKELLKSIFPSVVDYIDRFKKKRGYKSFSVFLQRLEASVFIDGLKKELDEKVGFNFTKHDAVIVRREDLEKALEVIKNYFEKIGFNGKMVVE